MNLLYTATQAFFVFASCCTPAAAISPQDVTSLPTNPKTDSPALQPAQAKA
jgi:hypothetical protein